MRINIKKLMKNMGCVAIGIVLCVAAWKPFHVHAAHTNSEIISAAAQIIYSNEGSYTSVAANDNGALSIGKLQWHGQRALALLQSIVNANPTQAEVLLGANLYEEVTGNLSSAWESRTLKSAEAEKIASLLATQESIQEQDALAMVDLLSYVEHGQRQGIVNEAALIYYADLENQGGAPASARIGESAKNIAGSMSAVTLNELHEAAINDSTLGLSAYQARRFGTYNYIVRLGWEYCGKNDSLIPSDYAVSRSEGAAWIQRALNKCMKAGLTVTGVYDDATMKAVSEYQAEKNITVDGLAGRSTIVHLMKSIAKGEDDSKTTTGSKTGSSDTKTDSTKTDDTKTDDTKTDDGNATGNGSNSNTSGNNSTGNNTDGKADTSEGTGLGTAAPATQLAATTLKSVKSSYKYNDIHAPFQLQVTSNRSNEPIRYASSNVNVVSVDGSGLVTVAGPGTTTILVTQSGNSKYSAGSMQVSVTIYSTDPSSYTFPTGSLYKGRIMAQSEIQWLQAAIRKLNGVNFKVNGVWSDKLTNQVKAFQKDCGMEADGIVGEQTKQVMKQMLAIKSTVPTVSLKSGADGNKLSWPSNANANRVYIFRKTGGESFQKIKTISKAGKTSYKDTKIESGKTYQYVIKFGTVYNKKKAVSQKSSAVSNLEGKIG